MAGDVEPRRIGPETRQSPGEQAVGLVRSIHSMFVTGDISPVFLLGRVQQLLELPVSDAPAIQTFVDSVARRIQGDPGLLTAAAGISTAQFISNLDYTRGMRLDCLFTQEPQPITIAARRTERNFLMVVIPIAI